MRQGWERWWMDLLLAGLTLVLGILILLNPFGATEVLMTILGSPGV